MDISIAFLAIQPAPPWVDLGGGGVQGVATPSPPNSQNHSAKCSATYVLMYVEALIHIAKRLVVVVVSSVQVVKPLSRPAVVHSEVLHLECPLGTRLN